MSQESSVKTVVLSKEDLGGKIGSEACAFVKEWAESQGLSGEDRVEYWDSGLWNAVNSMVFNEQRKQWNGTLRTRLSAAINQGKPKVERTRSTGSSGGKRGKKKTASLQLDVESGLIIFHFGDELGSEARFSVKDNEFVSNKEAMLYQSNTLYQFMRGSRKYVLDAVELDPEGNPYGAGWNLENYSSEKADKIQAMLDIQSQAISQNDVEFISKWAVKLMLNPDEVQAAMVAKTEGKKLEFLAAYYPEEVPAPKAETEPEQAAETQTEPAEEPAEEPTEEPVEVEAAPESTPAPTKRRSASVS